ncbi:unnamed protein product, partial [Medioppia subpectinata]
VDNDWKLIKISKGTNEPNPPNPGEGQTGGATETASEATNAPNNEATNPPENEANTEAAKQETNNNENPNNSAENNNNNQTLSAPAAGNDTLLYKWEDLGEDDGTTAITITPTSLLSDGSYKCSVKSMSGGKEKTTELVKQMRVIFRPPDGTPPEAKLISKDDSHIRIRCTAPASLPMTAITFFVNAEPAAREDVHRMDSIRVPNATYAEKQELQSTVEELRIRATKNTVLNERLYVYCGATLANFYNGSTLLDIAYDGPLHSDTSVTAAMIVLIIVIVLVVIIIIGAIVWVILRKKKIHALNKVSELFNKQKTITVLVDNPKDE